MINPVIDSPLLDCVGLYWIRIYNCKVGSIQVSQNFEAGIDQMNSSSCSLALYSFLVCLFGGGDPATSYLVVFFTIIYTILFHPLLPSHWVYPTI